MGRQQVAGRFVVKPTEPAGVRDTGAYGPSDTRHGHVKLHHNSDSPTTRGNVPPRSLL